MDDVYEIGNLHYQNKRQRNTENNSCSISIELILKLGNFLEKKQYHSQEIKHDTTSFF